MFVLLCYMHFGFSQKSYMYLWNSFTRERIKKELNVYWKTFKIIIWWFCGCNLNALERFWLSSVNIYWDKNARQTQLLPISFPLAFSEHVHYHSAQKWKRLCFHTLFQMWPRLIAKAKEGGLDVVQTLVFWNLHEPQPGQVKYQSTHNSLFFSVM